MRSSRLRLSLILTTSLSCLGFVAWYSHAGEALNSRQKSELTKRFHELDANRDQRLSSDEVNRRLFRFLNADQDSWITLDEALEVIASQGIKALEQAAAPELRKTGNSTDPGRDSPADAPSKSNPSSDSVRKAPQRLIASEYLVGQRLPDLAFTRMDGRTVRLSDLSSAQGVVVAFTNLTCPLCKKYAPTLSALEQKYSSQNIRFVYVNPTATDSDSDIADLIQSLQLSGAYTRDIDGSIASALRATHTTDAFLIDASRTLIYRGAIDDQYGFGYSLDQPRHRYLPDAIDSLISSGRPRIAATEAPGCPLDVSKVSSTAAATTPVTYHNQIARIFQNHCVQCHRDGGVGPFPLEDYESVKAQRGAIERVVEDDLMPPWFAARHLDNQPSPFINDCSLSRLDKQTVLSWLTSGCAEGNADDAPRPRQFASQWMIGEPDLILEIPEPFSVKATGTMPYQDAVIDPGFTEDQYIAAVEILPTAREVVHHCLVFVQPPNAGGRKSQPLREQDGFFAAYAPGYDALVFNQGYGKVIPAGSKLRFQLHYTPNGKETKDQTRIGFVFAKTPPKQLVKVTGLAQTKLAIPPHAPNHKVTKSITVPKDSTLLTFFPHMHLRGKAFQYMATYPDGRTELLLDIPRYDFNWQLSYRFAEPKTLPKGTTLTATAWYDNSKDNPANPDPDRTVTWGEQTYDEMMIGYVEYHEIESTER